MSNITDQNVQRYAEENSQADSALCQQLRQETCLSMKFPGNMSGRCTAQLLKMLIAISNARFVVDIGMFTGYSALSMAEALPENGQVASCEINPEAIKFATHFFEKSPHGHKISIHQMQASQMLEEIEAPIDLAFIDADKKKYPTYFEQIVNKLSTGGLIVMDNMLWSGDALYQTTDRGKILAELNAQVTKDPRVENVMLGIDDGLQIIRKLPY